MRRALIVLALPVVVAAVAGCGSSSSSSSSTPAAASTPPSTAASSSPTGGAAAPATGKTVDITYQNIAIQPASVTVRVGDKIKWTNQDGVIHNVTSESGPLHLASPNFGKGGTFEATATAPGVVHYVCTIHPTAMIGTITITK